MDLNRFTLHIFDLDDTLITTRQAYGFAQIAAIRDVFPKVKPQLLEDLQPDLQWFCQIFGSGNVREYMSAFLKSQPEIFNNNPSVLESILQRYHHHFQSHLTCFEGVKTFLEGLIDSGKNVALVSNGSTQSQLAKLKVTELVPYFPLPLVYISEDFPQELKKPSPFMLEKACQDARIDASQAIYYGNSVSDILAGNLAGVVTIHFAGSTALPGELPPIALPEFRFSHWLDLIVR